MKEITLFLTCICISVFSFCQTITQDTTKKDFKNVLSIDATLLLRQIFNEDAGGNYYYHSAKVIAYRRIFNNNAIRIELGGWIDNGD